MSKSRWTDKEIELYAEFLKKYRYDYVTPEQRKSNHIFTNMAKFIQTRDREQCASHHKIMVFKFKTIEGIVAYF